jgi:hypothetical protein
MLLLNLVVCPKLTIEISSISNVRVQSYTCHILYKYTLGPKPFSTHLLHLIVVDYLPQTLQRVEIHPAITESKFWFVLIAFTKWFYFHSVFEQRVKKNVGEKCTGERVHSFTYSFSRTIHLILFKFMRIYKGKDKFNVG